MLVLDQCWCSINAGGRSILVIDQFWCSINAGARSMLVVEQCLQTLQTSRALPSINTMPLLIRRHSF
jgi:hypothetical protein